MMQGFVPNVPAVVSSDAEVTEVTCVAPSSEGGDELLVLASDGLWDVMGNKDVVDFVRSRIRDDKDSKVGRDTALLSRSPFCADGDMALTASCCCARLR